MAPAHCSNSSNEEPGRYKPEAGGYKPENKPDTASDNEEPDTAPDNNKPESEYCESDEECKRDGGDYR